MIIEACVDCRAYLLEKGALENDYNHSRSSLNLTCKVCKDPSNIWLIHGPTQWYSGFNFECAHCRKYVLYSDKYNKINLPLFYKEEIYYENNLCIINDFDDNTLRLFDGDVCAITVPAFEYISYDEFLTKIKKYAAFT